MGFILQYLKVYLAVTKLKLKDWFDNINEGHFSILIVLITLLSVYAGYYTDSGNLQELGNRGIKLSAFLGTSLGFIKYLQTKSVDIWSEIIKEHNTALAIVLAALIIGVAACMLL